MTIMITVYNMVVLHMAYCICTVLFSVCSFLYPYCMIIFVDNLFFTWKASQWAVRLLWQPSDCMAILVIFVVLLSENKYDDDDDG